MPLNDPPINLGFFPDDPLVPQNSYRWFPDPSVYGDGPYPTVIGTRAGGFEMTDLTPLAQVFDDLVIEGFYCVAFQVRTMNGGLPFQTSDGKWHQQTDDFKKALRAIRTDPNNIGWTAGLGGSGSGHHALYCGIDGTIGDDRLDATVPLSPPTDFSDRQDDVFHSSIFIPNTSQYARLDPSDLVNLRARSPIALDLNNACPILHYNGDREAMPLSQLTLFSAAMDGIAGYTSIINTGPLGGAHAFAMWKGRNQIGVYKDVIQWLKDRYAEWSGGSGGEDNGLNDYTFQVFGGSGTVVGGRIPGNAVTCQLTGLPTNLPPPPPNLDNMGFSLIANNQYGPGPEGFDTFTPITKGGGQGGGGGSKRVPIGVINYIPTTLGVFDGLADLTFWSNRSIIGARLHTDWASVEASQGTLDLTTVNQFLSLCTTNQKRAMISISAGVGGLPDWTTSRMRVFTTSHGDVFPIPWDSDYISLFTTMLSQVGTAIDANAQLSAVVTGGTGSWGDTAESYIFTAGDVYTSDDIDALNAIAAADGFPDLKTAWESGLKSILLGWSAAFPTTQKVFDAHTWLQNQDADIPEMLGIALRAAPQCALMNESLTSTTDGTEPINAGLANTRALRGYKTANTNIHDATVFGATMTAGLALNPRFIEIGYLDAEYAADAASIRDTAGSLRTINSQQGGV